MSDLERFCKAMDGEWRVERYEVDGDRLCVVYRSLTFADMTWSHQPFGDLLAAPRVGTVGRIGFYWGGGPMP